ncbi:MAG: hypothetical protein MUC88_12930 [Planctomycetes bacterium]|jgi:hypothetical protein|nr:hypothetical protein [Planctomycetota bacterium]
MIASEKQSQFRYQTVWGALRALALGSGWPTAGYDPQRTSWAAEGQMPPAELLRYLDGPLVRRGDLFCIQNLVSTLEAGQ